MIKSIACIIILLSSITLYLGAHAGKSSAFDKIINISISVALFHAAFVLMCELFFPLQRYIDTAAPFGLLYGPLCYFSFYTLFGNLPGRNKVLLHLTPMMIGLVVYFILLLSPSFRLAYYPQVLLCLYVFAGISMISYTGLLLFYNDRDEKEHAQEGKKMVFTVLLLVFIVALLLIILSYSGAVSRKEVSAFLPRMIVYFTMLSVVFFAFRYQVYRILKRLRAPLPVPAIIFADKNLKDTLPYRKSAIEEEQLRIYQLRLEELMVRKELYLDVEMTLEKLAGLMHIPKHHLSQLFNTCIGKNFYEYLNILRVEYACRLLKDEALDFKLEEIGFQSGFNSKSSFNRYFKSQMGCTPSQYKDEKEKG